MVRKGPRLLSGSEVSPAENSHPSVLSSQVLPGARAMLSIVPMSHARPLVGTFHVALVAPSAPGPGRPASLSSRAQC